MNKMLSRLYQAVEQGHLLHGSPTRVPILCPRPANDTEKQGGNQTAVYATRNVLVAVLAGLLHRKPGRSCTRWRGSRTQMNAWGENVELSDGYVYILPPDTFRVVCTNDGEESNEYASPVAVEPLEIVEVMPQLLSMLNITLELR